MEHDDDHMRADREISRTLAARIMAEWISDKRSPAVMGLTIVRLHALLLAGVPSYARPEGIDRYVDTLEVMIEEIERFGP